MADQGDLRELLRMLTARKVPMITAMGHIKALQSKQLRTYAMQPCTFHETTTDSTRIDQIAQAPLTAVESAITDPKVAKSFHAACKAHGKKPPKRAGDDADDPSSPTAKRARLEPHKRDLDYGSMGSDELEDSLALPFVEDEDVIAKTAVTTNRAPLVLAFAVEVLRVTMPEQPPSSRLSLAQAVVSANSRTKAISLGIEKAPPGGDETIPEGQPKVRVLGREVPVLKRGGYTWSGKETNTAATAVDATSQNSETDPTGGKIWSASQKLTSRASTFVAHAAEITSPSQRVNVVKTLMADKPELESATHNAWAVRTSYGNSPLVQEASFDDGESGCGKFMLQVMREAGVTNTVVVLTRWYGGIMLGPDRWRLMRECVNDALASRRRRTGAAAKLSGEAVWALDPEDKKPSVSTVGMAIHRPEGARNYLLRSFPSAPPPGDESIEGESSKKTAAALNEEKQANLGRLLGAIRLLVTSWATFLPKDELDRRAWGWYVAVRPDVESGPGGWGAKGRLELAKILKLRRRVKQPDGG